MVNIKNPLGIIALFVTFLDGITGLVISSNFDNLHGASERIPLIYFIILFPVIVLIAFVILVIIYPIHLYGPRDFDNQEEYLMALGKEIRPNVVPKPLKKVERIPIKREKIERCKLISYSDSLLEKMQENALQRYADEHKMKIKTDVQISQDFVCDGIAEEKGMFTLFEVKLNYESLKIENIENKLLRICEALYNKGINKLHVVLILVSEEKLSEQDLKNLLGKMNHIVQNLEIVNYTKNEIKE